MKPNVTYTILYLISIIFYSCSSSVKPPSATGIDVSEMQPPAPQARLQPVSYKERAAASYLDQFIDTIQISGFAKINHDPSYIQKDLKGYYSLNNNNLIWLTETGLKKETKLLFNELLQAEKHGLNPEDYHTSELIELQNDIFNKSFIMPAELAELDIKISIAYIAYAWHLRNGYDIPYYNEKNLLRKVPKVSVLNAIGTLPVRGALQKLQPQSESYHATMKALEKYRKIEFEGGWEQLPEDLVLKPGDSSFYVLKIYERLRKTGDIPEPLNNVGAYDDGLMVGVMRFQSRHGLATDGIIGKSTVKALNIPVSEKIRKLALNLDRMRQMPREMGKHYFVVNIPAFELNVYKDNKQTLGMRTIVGNKKTPTPIFHDHLEYLVFSPTWTVPRSIIVNEMLPRLKSDSTYLSRNGYKLYNSWDENAEPIDQMSINWSEINPSNINLRVVQNPGPTNALGRVKFIMPNSSRIYLHDTSAPYLFTRSERALSHGCIRVEKPAHLAAYLLRQKDGWDEKAVEKSMAMDKPQTVLLDEQIPVYIIYRSAWGDADGTVNFRNDVYGYDTPSMGIKYASAE